MIKIVIKKIRRVIECAMVVTGLIGCGEYVEAIYDHAGECYVPGSECEAQARATAAAPCEIAQVEVVVVDEVWQWSCPEIEEKSISVPGLGEVVRVNTYVFAEWDRKRGYWWDQKRGECVLL